MQAFIKIWSVNHFANTFCTLYLFIANILIPKIFPPTVDRYIDTCRYIHVGVPCIPESNLFIMNSNVHNMHQNYHTEKDVWNDINIVPSIGYRQRCTLLLNFKSLVCYRLSWHAKFSDENSMHMVGINFIHFEKGTCLLDVESIRFIKTEHIYYIGLSSTRAILHITLKIRNL